MSALKYWIWLASIDALGARSAVRLLDGFGAPENVYFADEDEYARREDISDVAKRALADKSLETADRILAECDRLGIRVVTPQDTDYPDRLKGISAPPCVLYVKGKLPVIDEEPALCVVGTRSATPYGLDAARRICSDLAKGGLTLVSGLAQGVDTQAHRSAIGAAKPSVAVLACGADVIYPAENKDLYADIAACGAIISEYPPGTRALGANFPARNRILSGLALGTLVIEAGARSGALITAHAAMEQGRDVFCVPGNIVSPASEGCHALIREGATLVTCAADILREYAPLYPQRIAAAPAPAAPVRPAPAPKTGSAPAEPAPARPLDITALVTGYTPSQQAVLICAAATPVTADEIVALTSLPVRQVLTDLTLLEIDGIMEQLPGKRFIMKISQRREGGKT
ncbi:MAG: DNA-processing protein DprA [Oscillospiraceae bacterium]|jgi:DNA processing protein|nr:DNA-processing protein DprA [Oscillospiraceae bacterium]